MTSSRLPGILAVIAVAAAAGCAGHAAGPAAAPATAAAARAAAAPSCKQQYAAWKNGPARAQARQLVSALNAVQAAAGPEDVPAMKAAFGKAGRAAARLGRDPMPGCADPHGYWKSLLDRIRAAGDNAGSGSGLSGLLLAEAPLEAVPGLEKKLAAELRRTAGTGSLPR